MGCGSSAAAAGQPTKQPCRSVYEKSSDTSGSEECGRDEEAPPSESFARSLGAQQGESKRFSLGMPDASAPRDGTDSASTDSTAPTPKLGDVAGPVVKSPASDDITPATDRPNVQLSPPSGSLQRPESVGSPQSPLAGAPPLRAKSLQLRGVSKRSSVEADSRDWVRLAAAQRLPDAHGINYEMVDGVVQSSESAGPSYVDYARDVSDLLQIVEDGPCRSVCRNRLKILETKYEMHITLNRHREEAQTALSWDAGGGVSSTMKVDHHRLATCMSADYLVRSIREKARSAGSDVVQIGDDGSPVTLQEFLRKHGIQHVDRLTSDSLGLMPGPQKMFHRFDVFSRTLTRGNKGSVDILTLFLKARNAVRGRYFAELVRPILERYGRVDSQIATEMRVPIFGMNDGEWMYLAQWINQHGLRAPNHRWIIQIPRIAEIRTNPMYECSSLQDQLDHIFLPLWRATCHPKEYPEIANFLLTVSSFNVISDEANSVQDLPRQPRPPREWDWQTDNPPDIFFNFYVWANINSLNALRKSLGLNTFKYCPHCGEMGGVDHFVSAFLLADSINHGIRMQKHAVLSYLFFLTRTGLVMSPMSNNCLHLQPYHTSPFPKFAKIGLNVMLASDDPLHFHHSDDAVLEEYGTAQKLFQLGSVDLCEVARNSIIISGFSPRWKRRHLGGLPPLGNDPTVTHVPPIRLRYRKECWDWETALIRKRMRAVGRRTSTQEGSQKLPAVLRHTAKDSCAAGAGVGGEEQEEQLEFHRVEIIPPTAAGSRTELAPDRVAARRIRTALALRRRYIWQHPEPIWKRAQAARNAGDVKYTAKFEGGVFLVEGTTSSGDAYSLAPAVSAAEFHEDFTKLHDIAEEVDVRVLAQRRLELLEEKYSLHVALNALDEGDSGQRSFADDQHRDFYQSFKVDTHIHMAAGMTASELLSFIIHKARFHSDDIVMMKEGRPVTLGQFFENIGVDATRLTVDTLNVQADATLFERFDNFNDKYNPMGNADLRTLLLKTDNYMGGRYFAELLKGVFTDLEQGVYTNTEGRLSIYGRKRDEWKKLAGWFDIHGMNHVQNKWMVQIPRVYSVFKKLGFVKSFGEMLENIFEPLWHVSIDPASDPKLDHFLSHMSGFDSVDNESVLDSAFSVHVSPSEWTSDSNPPYAYWMYYMWVNIRQLNEFRAARGMSVWTFRPHCGESGHTDHLVACYLTADAVNHGINVASNPALEYLYYLAQVGMAVSPLSNNSLFLEYMKNPFPCFFRRGLNVSLSTDDPLQFHTTQEPLIEEYSIASKIWKLSPTDMCEIARNSVLQSGFDHRTKQQWLGEQYFLSSAAGNLCERSHLPDTRVQYRYEAYHDELDALEQLASDGLAPDPFCRFMSTPEEEMLTQKGMLDSGLSSFKGRRTGAGRGDVESPQSPKKSLEKKTSTVVNPLVKDLEKERDSLKRELEQLRRELTRPRTPETGTLGAPLDRTRRHISALRGAVRMQRSPGLASSLSMSSVASFRRPGASRIHRVPSEQDSHKGALRPQRPSVSRSFSGLEDLSAASPPGSVASAQLLPQEKRVVGKGDAASDDESCYARILVHGDDGGDEMDRACVKLCNALLVRERYRAYDTYLLSPRDA